MSFDLTVSYRSLPEALKGEWERMLLLHGFDVEICPGFEPAGWEGGFLPMCLRRAPSQLIGFELPNDAVSGCEVSFAPESAFFRFGTGGPTTEFAVLCFAAASLAAIASGRYLDPQAGREFDAVRAVEAATEQVLGYVQSAGQQQLVHHEFPGWAALLGG